MGVKVRDKDMGFKKLQRTLEKADKKAVDVGYWAGETFEDNGADLAKVARSNEFGIPGRIPERSFMRSTYDENKDKIMNEYEKYLEVDTKTAAVRSLMKLGALVTGMIKKKIKAARSWAVPNAPTTVKNKKSDAPLFDTGNMFNKIDFREAE